MDLKELLKKTQNKVDQSKPTKIRQVSIALDDRPYDEFVEHVKNNKFEKVKEANASPELKKEPLKIVPKKEQKKEIVEIYSEENELPTTKETIKREKFQPKEHAFHVPLKQEFSLEDYGIIFLKLAGIEKKLVDCFFEFTKKNNTMRIGPISREQICSMLATNINTFKRTLRKLKDKNILSTTYYKTGKGGWAIYEFNTKFYQELISGERIKLVLKEEFLEHQPSFVQQPEPVKINTNNLLPEGWDTLDFEDLAEKGFTKNHLIQIYQDQAKIGKVFDSNALQYSIDAFRYDLEHNLSVLTQKSHSKSPVTFFTQILSKGRPYNSFTPEKFKTPQELEFIKYKEKSEKIHKDFEDLKSKFFQSEYQTWYKDLSENDMEEILKQRNANMENVPVTVQKTLKAKAIQEYFEQYVWIDIQKKLHQKFYS